METDNNFPERLRQLRVLKGLSQTELGEKAQIDYTHIGKYERGLSNPSLDTLVLLSDTLGVTLDYLVKGNEEDAAIAKMSDRELLSMFERSENLSEKDKEHVKALLGSFLRDKEMEKRYVRQELSAKENP